MKIAVIGGGINGVMTAWELCKYGHSVTLFERHTLISQTSSASSKLLHGGLRYLENFEFLTEQNIFKSIGFIRLEDNSKNNYEFSQICIDTKKKEILGTDIKAFMNSNDFKISPKKKATNPTYFKKKMQNPRTKNNTSNKN